MRKKKSNKTIYFAILIISIMVFSAFAIITSNLSDDSNLKYNGFKFQNYQNRWYTKINEQEYLFHYHPAELESIPSPNLESFKTPQIYLTFDPEIESEYLDLSRLKFKEFFIITYNSFPANAIAESSENYDLPVVTCQDATQSVPVIFYQKGNQTEINFESNCLYLTAKLEPDFLKLTERVMYSLLGVIND